jgi:NAD(P)H-hydrate repair Nnr-like enzyme with NAD(P)H-hydrate epimerase domain
LQAGGSLVIPLSVRNPTAGAREVILAVDVPSGWTVQSGAGKFTVAAKQWGADRIEINLPAIADATKTKEDAKEVTVRAESNGQTVGTIKLRVELRKRALPE